MKLSSAVYELRSAGVHLRRYPQGLVRSRFCESTPPPGVEPLDTPVVLVHGLFHNNSAFHDMAASLRSRGFRWVWSIDYDPFGGRLEDLALVVERCVYRTLDRTGADRVHLLGHSMGGLVVRWFVQELAGSETVDTCVTIATPHAGTLGARVIPREPFRQLRPGSPELRRLAASLDETPARFVNFYSEDDPVIVPASSTVLPDGPGRENHAVPVPGHSSLLLSRRVQKSVAAALPTSPTRGITEVAA